jgi:hypothetical protein
MANQIYKNDVAGKLYALHSYSKRTYVYKRGSQTEFSSAFRKAFRETLITVLPDEVKDLYFYNRFTKRIVKRTSVYRKDGRYTAAYQKRLKAEVIKSSGNQQAYPQSQWLDVITALGRGYMGPTPGRDPNPFRTVQAHGFSDLGFSKLRE